MDRQLALEAATARKLKSARTNPPTFLGLLARWSSLPGLLAVGIAGTVGLAVMTQRPGGALTRDWPIAYASLFLGAILRDVGTARRGAKIWPAQARFIDWAKVDQASLE
jgi:hypothetical protein